RGERGRNTGGRAGTSPPRVVRGHLAASPDSQGGRPGLGTARAAAADLPASAEAPERGPQLGGRVRRVLERETGCSRRTPRSEARPQEEMISGPSARFAPLRDRRAVWCARARASAQKALPASRNNGP